MADYRRPCPICGGEPWADSKNGTIYCDCGLRYHMNGECHPEWHRMDWTADEWNHLANVRAENAKLRELVRTIWLAGDFRAFLGVGELEVRMRELGIEVE